MNEICIEMNKKLMGPQKLFLFKRLYYMTITGMLLFCTYYTVFNLLVDNQLRFFAFTIDTIYLEWNTSFPAVSICEIYNGEKTWDLSEKLYGSDRNSKLDDLISDVTFFNGKCYACSLCSKDLLCPNISDIVTKFRSTCEEMFVSTACLWNNKVIRCCDVFLPLQTENGKCFTINSIHTNNRITLISNRVTGPGVLSFEINEDVQVYVHAPNEVPHSVGENVFYGSNKEIIVSVKDIVNDPSVKDISIANRKCRFPSERENLYTKIYEHYSHSTCTVECSMDIQIKLCNCSHHSMPRPRRADNVNICDIEGLICLTNNFGKINSMRKKDCLGSCLPSCEEPEYNTLYSSTNDNYRDEPGSLVTIRLIDLPKERYIRHVVRTVLDDVISIGGTISLLFGISIIGTLDYLVRFLKYLLTLRGKCLLKQAARK